MPRAITQYATGSTQEQPQSARELSSVHLGTYLAYVWDRVYPSLADHPRGAPEGERENADTAANAMHLLGRMIERGNKWRGGLARIEQGGTLHLANSMLEKICRPFSARLCCDLLKYLERVELVTVQMHGRGRARERHVTLKLASIAAAPAVVGSPDPPCAAPRQTLAPGRRNTDTSYPPLSSTVCRSTRASERPSEIDRGPEAGAPDELPENAPEVREAAAPAVEEYQRHRRCPRAKRLGDPITTDRAREAEQHAAAASRAGATPQQLAAVVRGHLGTYDPEEHCRQGGQYVTSFGWCRDALADYAERTEERGAARRRQAAPPPEPRDDGPDLAPHLSATSGINAGGLRSRLDAAGIAHGDGDGQYTLRIKLAQALAEGKA